MAILNAIRLPPDGRVAIADDFSPVNTFRLILREYLGVPLDDLETRNRVFLNDDDIWRFRDVTGVLAGGVE